MPVLDDRPYSLQIDDQGLLEVGSDGELIRDYSVASRCRFRLTCRRGEYWVDPTLGSRFHELKTLKDAKAKVQAYAEEALQPLVDDGSILGVQVGEVSEDPETGMLLAAIAVEVSEDAAIQLGLLPLGSA